MRLMLDLENWHLICRVTHSEHDEKSTESHLTLRSLQASHDGSFRRFRYGRLCISYSPPEWGGPPVYAW